MPIRRVILTPAVMHAYPCKNKLINKAIYMYIPISCQDPFWHLAKPKLMEADDAGYESYKDLLSQVVAEYLSNLDTDCKTA